MDTLFVRKGERYAVIGLVATDGRPLATSARILLSAVSTSFNSGLAIDPQKMAKDRQYAHGLARSITSRGKLPILTARVGLSLRAPWLTGRRFRMLDYNANVLSSGVLNGPELCLPTDLPVYITEILAPAVAGPR